jgi:F-type H+-transporting ATPase subunit a
MLLLSPLEQFQILSLVTLKIFGFDFSITNALLVNILAFLCFSGTIYLFSSNKNCLDKSSFFFIPNPWQVVFESIYEVVSQLVFDLVSTGSEKYFPFITVIFSFILFNNLIGLVPYSFTITSHLIITFTLSFAIFIGLNIICYQRHSIHMFSLFLPANTTFFLALLLVPIEFVSYIAKPISLGVRLFINLMAGHSLLKVIVGFAWSMLLLDGLQAFSFLIPLFILTLLMGLELGVALIQTYVFITLTCIYLNESEVLH